MNTYNPDYESQRPNSSFPGLEETYPVANLATTVEDTPSHDIEGSDRFFTVPTVTMTIPRAIAGVAIPTLAIMGRNTTALTVAAAISDKESWVAKLTDKLLPGKGLGQSKEGAEIDYKADFILGVGSIIAALATKRTPPLAKVAATLGGVKQARQIMWAVPAARDYEAQTGEPLKTKVDWTGKWGTAVLMASSAANTVARDIKPETPAKTRARSILSVSSLALAGASVVLGHISTKRNEQQRQAKLRAFAAETQQ